MNVLTMSGRLVRDPEFKFTSTGIALAKFTVAVDRRVKKDVESKTDFINCVAFGKTAEFIGEYFRKGKKILIEGSMQMNRYKKNDTTKISYYVAIKNVEFADSKKKDEETNSDILKNQEKIDKEIKEKEIDTNFEYDEQDIEYEELPF